ncbi:MAG: DJ-1/PfpI family protein [Megasphaera sp.]|jgi:putative intracellular protease/amidase|nr:DJ-1/PfpI family protein [Megasphaera sp.]
MSIDETLPLGLIANTAAILGIPLGEKTMPEIVETEGVDQNGNTHLGIIAFPVPVLKELSDVIKEIKKREMDIVEIYIILFHDFETLDAFGPVEILGRIREYHLHFVSYVGGTVISRQGIPVITERLDSVNDGGVVLIPGGMGTRPLVTDTAFLKTLVPIIDMSAYCLTVCTGSVLLAQTGRLDGRKATSNKKAFFWVKTTRPAVLWQGKARWVVDGKFYTSSGISAGIDMTLGFICDRYGRNKAVEIAQSIEYNWQENKNCDPFAVGNN